MRLNLKWISRRKIFLAPLVLLVLLMAIAACGSDSSTTAAQDAIATEQMEDEAAMEEADSSAPFTLKPLIGDF